MIPGSGGAPGCRQGEGTRQWARRQDEAQDEQQDEYMTPAKRPIHWRYYKARLSSLDSCLDGTITFL
jgi:hypothetical protein